MTPPEPFEWFQRDACELLCTACDTVVDAGSADLHLRTCEGSA